MLHVYFSFIPSYFIIFLSFEFENAIFEYKNKFILLAKNNSAEYFFFCSSHLT